MHVCYLQAEEIAKLTEDRDNEKRSFFSQRRVSETTLGRMQDDNEGLRLELSKVE